MIVQENVILDERELVKTYSDNGKYIVQKETGIKYTEAIDIPNKHTYIESEEDFPCEPENESEGVGDRWINLQGGVPAYYLEENPDEDIFVSVEEEV